MKTEQKVSTHKPYTRPELVIYGDIQEITRHDPKSQRVPDNNTGADLNKT